MYFFLLQLLKKPINAVPRPARCTISASFNRYSLNADLSHTCKLNSCKLLCNINSKLHSNLIVLSVPTSIGVQASVLIDCGSTTNFISKRFVLLNQISSVNTATSQVVRLADGSVSTTCKLVQSLHLYINDREICESLLVFPIESFDIILGMPWLKKHNPNINWETNQIVFPVSPLKNLLKANNLFNSSSSLSFPPLSSPSSQKSNSLPPPPPSSVSISPIQICHISAEQVRKSIKKGEQFFLLFVRQKKGSSDIEFNNLNGNSVSSAEEKSAYINTVMFFQKTYLNVCLLKDLLNTRLNYNLTLLLLFVIIIVSLLKTWMNSKFI